MGFKKEKEETIAHQRTKFKLILNFSLYTDKFFLTKYLSELWKVLASTLEAISVTRLNWKRPP